MKNKFFEICNQCPKKDIDFNNGKFITDHEYLKDGDKIIPGTDHIGDLLYCKDKNIINQLKELLFINRYKFLNVIHHHNYLVDMNKESDKIFGSICENCKMIPSKDIETDKNIIKDLDKYLNKNHLKIKIFKSCPFYMEHFLNKEKNINLEE